MDALFFWISAVFSLDKYPEVGWDCMVVLVLILLRNIPTVGCTNFHSHQPCTRVPFSPHPHQHVQALACLMTAILTGAKWYLVVVLICMSLVISGVGLAVSVRLSIPAPQLWDAEMLTSVLRREVLNLSWNHYVELSRAPIVSISELGITER